jgi:hypothetical protein
LDHSEIPFLPDLDQRELLMAQNYLIKQKEENGFEINKKNQASFFNQNSLIEKQEKIAYERIYSIIKEKISNSDIIDSYIYEKSYDFDNIKSQRKFFVDIKNDPTFEEISEKQSMLDSKINNPVHGEIRNTADMINNFIIKFKINEMKPVEYAKEYVKSKEYKIEPFVSPKENQKPEKKEKISYSRYQIEKSL